MNTAYPLSEKLLARVRGHGKGWVFTGRDFVGLGKRPAIHQALSRLARQGLFRRIARGIYYYPKVNHELGGVLSPSPQEVVQAVSRRSGGRLLPSGAMAANLLGLSTQVPVRMVYLTDGRHRTVRVGPYTLTFRHASPRTMAVSGRSSAIIFQALRHLGRNGVSEAVVNTLRRMLPAEDKRQLDRDTPLAVGWMRPVLMRIVGKGGGS